MIYGGSSGTQFYPFTTGSQTVGPYFTIALDWAGANVLVAEGMPGQRIVVKGRLVAGDNLPVDDGLIEIWQADGEGRYAHPDDPDGRSGDAAFRGFGRAATDEDGRFEFVTIKPGTVRWPKEGKQAPHLNVGIFARGLMRRLATRVYFPDESANESDPILELVAPARRQTLISHQRAGERGVYHWTVKLHGHDETVFFEF